MLQQIPRFLRRPVFRVIRRKTISAIRTQIFGFLGPRMAFGHNLAQGIFSGLVGLVGQFFLRSCPTRWTPPCMCTENISTVNKKVFYVDIIEYNFQVYFENLLTEYKKNIFVNMKTFFKRQTKIHIYKCSNLEA